MIKVSVLYPYSEGSKFDHDYYRDSHLPLVKKLLGEAMVYYGIDKALGGDTPPAFHAMCHLVLRSPEDLGALSEHMGTFAADIPNYTDVQPTVQVSEIIVERG